MPKLAQAQGPAGVWDPLLGLSWASLRPPPSPGFSTTHMRCHLSKTGQELALVTRNRAWPARAARAALRGDLTVCSIWGTGQVTQF